MSQFDYVIRSSLGTVSLSSLLTRDHGNVKNFNNTRHCCCMHSECSLAQRPKMIITKLLFRFYLLQAYYPVGKNFNRCDEHWKESAKEQHVWYCIIQNGYRIDPWIILRGSTFNNVVWYQASHFIEFFTMWLVSKCTHFCETITFIEDKLKNTYFGTFDHRSVWCDMYDALISIRKYRGNARGSFAAMSLSRIGSHAGQIFNFYFINVFGSLSRDYF